MYQLSDHQIEYIRREILAQGIQNEELQQDLLDHICCIVEHELNEEDDFETFCRQRMKHFYKNELKEIEEETIALLKFKHYYVIKKIMLLSGGVLTALFVTAFILKFLHLPGGSIALLLGIFLLNFVFLPMLFALKIKENKNFRENTISAIATLCAILMNLCLVFKLQQYPGADLLLVASFGTLLIGFLPIYFFTGISRPETKVNTIVSSVIILSAVALVLILMRSPKAMLDSNPEATESVLRSEQILSKQRKLVDKIITTAEVPADLKGKEIADLCEMIKQYLIKRETEHSTLDTVNKIYISEICVADYIDDEPDIQAVVAATQTAILSYNKTLSSGLRRLSSIDNINRRKVPEALNDLIQLQIIISQNYLEQYLNK